MRVLPSGRMRGERGTGRRVGVERERERGGRRGGEGRREGGGGAEEEGRGRGKKVEEGRGEGREPEERSNGVDMTNAPGVIARSGGVVGIGNPLAIISALRFSECTNRYLLRS